MNVVAKVIELLLLLAGVSPGQKTGQDRAAAAKDCPAFLVPRYLPPLGLATSPG